MMPYGHYNDGTWTPWCFKLLTTRLFVQKLVQAPTKKISTFCITGHFFMMPYGHYHDGTWTPWCFKLLFVQKLIQGPTKKTPNFCITGCFFLRKIHHSQVDSHHKSQYVESVSMSWHYHVSIGHNKLAPNLPRQNLGYTVLLYIEVTKLIWSNTSRGWAFSSQLGELIIWYHVWYWFFYDGQDFFLLQWEQNWTGDKPLHEPMLTQFSDTYMQH